MVQSQHGQVVQETLSQKYPIQNRAGGVIQLAEHLFMRPGKKKRLKSYLNEQSHSGHKSKSISPHHVPAWWKSGIFI
jgi:hypothetical protein